eukprot:TRINITY_DN77463_c0_g1_i1.p1 TRINITY_DN77463_c0_g1~~TRINITY_DN77463_c0_g1_i1.p1  ORF type:complete len:302 (-),score=68.90 TRINITY_DN77463_c0_g1_i1:80-934(-)
MVGASEAETGTRQLQVWQDAKSWAEGAANTVADGVVDGYETTADWASATAKAAAGSYERAKTNVENEAEEINKLLDGATSDESLIDAGMFALKQAFPSCTELGYVIRSSLSNSLDQQIDSIFALQACSEAMNSTACFDLIHNMLAAVMFEALWLPVNVGLKGVTGGGNLATSVALGAAKSLVKIRLQPHMLVAAKPGATTIHGELSKMSVDMSDADAVLVAAKAQVQASKDEMLRAGEAALLDVCTAIGLPPNKAGASHAAAVQRISPMAFCVTICTSFLFWRG